MFGKLKITSYFTMMEQLKGNRDFVFVNNERFMLSTKEGGKSDNMKTGLYHEIEQNKIIDNIHKLFDVSDYKE